MCIRSSLRYSSSNELFLCQNCKTNYNIVPYSTEGVKHSKVTKLWVLKNSTVYHLTRIFANWVRKHESLNLWRFERELTPYVPAALVMQGLDVGRMSCSSLTAHTADVHQSKDTLCHSEPLTDAFYWAYPSSNEPFLCQNFKSNCTVVPYGDHGTQGVKNHTLEKQDEPLWNPHDFHQFWWKWDGVCVDLAWFPCWATVWSSYFV
jgi:hypothetical protein